MRYPRDLIGYGRHTPDPQWPGGARFALQIVMHMRLAGRPGRAAGLARFLDHVLRHEGVWICRRVDIARHWIATHPYPGPR